MSSLTVVMTTMFMAIMMLVAVTTTATASASSYEAVEVEIGADGFEVERDLQNYRRGDDDRQGGNGNCPEPLRQFQSEVIVDFNGYDDDYKDTTSISFTGLEQAFRDAYNSLSYEMCDDQYRRIVDVQIVVNENGEIVIPRGGFEFSIRYLVTGVCRGCSPSSTTLFSQPSFSSRKLIGYDGKEIDNDGAASKSRPNENQSERRAKSDKSSKGSKSSKSSKKDGKGKGSGSYDDDDFGKGGGNNLPGKGGDYDDDEVGKGGGNNLPGKGGDYDDDFFGKGGGDDGSCECDAKFPTYTAPSEAEFCKTYDAAIKFFGERNRPHRRGGVSVDVLVKCTEISEESCSVVVEDFTSLVSVEFFGDRSAVTDAERAVLEENFVQAYNGLQDNRCDTPVFRTATLADIVLVSDPGEVRVFMYVFAVTGTCRGVGCSEELRFFADAESGIRQLTRQLQTTGEECGCPEFGTDFGPPSLADMEVRYFQVVQDLRESGQITSIDSSGRFMQLPFDFTVPPTAPPAGTPTSTLGPSNAGDTSAPSTTPSSSASPSVNQPFESEPPSVSDAPSSTDTSSAPSLSDAPTSTDASNAPSISNAPTNDVTDLSRAPSLSAAPSVSNAPSPTVSDVSRAPSLSAVPSNPPSPEDDSEAPSQSPSNQPSASNEPSRQPSASNAPSLSSAPSSVPSLSSAPSLSLEPSATPSQ